MTYFDNSALRATTVNKEVKDYPTTVENWDDPATNKWTDWDQKYITTETRAVAMKNNINYGVALLASQVSKGDYTSLMDNRKAIINDGITEDQDITIDDNSFIMTGILIGGQPTQVGWDFLPVAGDARDMVVYDRLLSKDNASGKYDLIEYPKEVYVKDVSTKHYSFVTKAGTSKNYTILLDNYQASQASDQVQDIAVAIELVNNTGKEFYGRDNIIPVGGTFYLAGKLTMTSAQTNHSEINWDTYIATNQDYKDRFPAYGVDRIFTQDHTTEATFTFTADALKHAYNTIPDLRSIQMLFGLSVDLKWESGLKINVEL